MPDARTEFVPSAAFLEFVDQHVGVDGVLLPWHEWWGPDVFEALVPDADTRGTLANEMQRVPRAFYDEPIMLPPAWSTRPGAYVQLSPAYERDRERAARWRWPTRTFDGRHLDLTIRPDDTAATVIDLVATVTAAN